FRRYRGVVYLDFGSFGLMSPYEKEGMAAFVENAALGNAAAAQAQFERLAIISPDTDIKAYREETRRILARWHDASKDPKSPLEERHVGMVFGRMLDASRRHHVKLGAAKLL